MNLVRLREAAPVAGLMLAAFLAGCGPDGRMLPPPLPVNSTATVTIDGVVRYQGVATYQERYEVGPAAGGSCDEAFAVHLQTEGGFYAILTSPSPIEEGLQVALPAPFLLAAGQPVTWWEDGIAYEVFDGIATVRHLSGGDLTLHVEDAILCRNDSYGCFAYCEPVDLLEIDVVADPGYEGQMETICGRAEPAYTALFGDALCAAYYRPPCDGSNPPDPASEPSEAELCP